MANTIAAYLLDGLGPNTSRSYFIAVGLLAAADTPPLAVDDAESVASGSPVQVAVLDNDLAVAPAALVPSSVSIVIAPPNGDAIANSDGTITYTSDVGYTGFDTLTYQVLDNEGAAAQADLVMTVTTALARKGGIGRYSRKRRRLMVDGELYTVYTKADERAVLAQYVKSQRLVLEAAEEHDKPAIRARIRRVEKRRDSAVNAMLAEIQAQEARMRQLQDEDEEILALLVLH